MQTTANKTAQLKRNEAGGRQIHEIPSRQSAVISCPIAMGLRSYNSTYEVISFFDTSS